MERIVPENKKYRVASLFSGIGGIDLGFEYAGFDVIWANDIDKWAVKTYKENVSDKIICGDIKNLKDSIPEHDILVAGIPCQSFSIMGSLRGFEDIRGTLFFDVCEIAKKHKTKVLMIENVAHIIHHDKGKTLTIILETLDSLGYFYFYKILDSVDYGLPQKRRRFFLLALHSDHFKYSEFKFPEKQILQSESFDFLDSDVGKSKYFINKFSIDSILSYGTGGFHKKPTIDEKICKPLLASMEKMHRAGVDNYFTDNTNYERYCIKEEKSNIRMLTPTECGKLQGFPSDWVQVVSDKQSYKQFGNAVTVNVSYAIASNLMKYIDENIIGDKI